jgi:hypothetical protein
VAGFQAVLLATADELARLIPVIKSMGLKRY